MRSVRGKNIFEVTWLFVVYFRPRSVDRSVGFRVFQILVRGVFLNASWSFEYFVACGRALDLQWYRNGDTGHASAP